MADIWKHQCTKKAYHHRIFWGGRGWEQLNFYSFLNTEPGKLVCGLCAVTGIFILTLPIPIVVTSFASCYKNRLWRNQITQKKRMLAEDLRPGLIAEKRNMFADMAGQGGFYIGPERGRQSCSFHKTEPN